VSLDDSTLIAAAMHRHADIVEWARTQGCPWHLHDCGPMDVPDRARQPVRHSYYYSPKPLIVSAAACGSVPLLQWLRTLGCPWDAEVCAAAAERGHFSGFMRMAVLGIRALVHGQQRKINWQYCSGYARTTAPGIQTLPVLLRLKATWSC
jgi:hypothetical protein